MLESVLAGLAILSSLYVVAVAISSIRVTRAVPALAALSPPDPPVWPRVSVIIPACNEADTIEQALRSRLAEGYPNAEYIVVNDRSTDGTGEIIERLAAEDARIVAVHVAALPDRWLGKVHALHVGAGVATGEWILFSDADIHHAPGTLRRAVAYCEQRGVDHLAMFPWVWSGKGFCHDGVMNMLMRLLTSGSRAYKVPDPRSKVSVGGGVFSLVRRDAFDRSGGLEPLRMEVADDVGLGQRLKWSGARQDVLNGRGLVGLWFYNSVGEVVRGMEKNAFAVIGRFDVARFIVTIALLSICELGAFAALAASSTWVVALAASSIAVMTLAQLAVARWLGRPLLPTVLAPLAWLVFLFGSLRSAILTLARGGITWRGTHYPLAALREGRRYVLG